jgi:lysozyme
MRALLIAVPIVAAVAYLAMRGRLDLIAQNLSSSDEDPAGDAFAGAVAGAEPADAASAGGFFQSIELAGAGIVAGVESVAAAVRRAVATALSSAGLSAIAAHEQLRLTPYKDQAGLWTIGYGHKLRPGEWYDAIDEAKADALMADDTAEAQAAVRRYVTRPLTQAQFDALVSLVFNIGAGAFAGSTLLVKLNAGDDAGAAAEFPKWKYVTINGRKQPSDGLLARRESEAQLFLSEA